MSPVNMGNDFSIKKTKPSVIKFVKYWNRGYTWDCGNRRSKWGHISFGDDKKGGKWTDLAKKKLSNDRKVLLEKEEETTFRAQLKFKKFYILYWIYKTFLNKGTCMLKSG